MTETKLQYCDRIALFMPREMKPALESLAIPCKCGCTVCCGWKLSTMLRAELAPASWTARRSKERL